MRGIILAVTFMVLVLTSLVILTGKITQGTVPQPLETEKKCLHANLIVLLNDQRKLKLCRWYFGCQDELFATQLISPGTVLKFDAFPNILPTVERDSLQALGFHFALLRSFRN